MMPSSSAWGRRWVRRRRRLAVLACALVGAVVAFSSLESTRGAEENVLPNTAPDDRNGPGFAAPASRSRRSGRTCVLTISSWNNFAHVLTFVETASLVNPQIGCWVWGVADRPEAPPLIRAPGWVRVATLVELQRHNGDFPLLELAMKYSMVEFNTAIKAVCVVYCIEALGARKVLYFDNDVWVRRSLGEVEALLDSYSIVVTPHITSPAPVDGLKQTDTQISMAGIFNFGFVALADTETARSFLEWWRLRLRFYGFVDVARGMHFDQGWGDFVPAFFDHDDYYVLRDPRYNVAYWNLHYVSLANQQDDIVFFHFSGVSNFLKYSPHEISRHQTRYDIFDVPALEPIVASYTKMLRDRNASLYRKLEYGFASMDDGLIQVIPLLREMYAAALDPDCDERKQRYFLGVVDWAHPFRADKVVVRRGGPPRRRQQHTSSSPSTKISVLQWAFEGPYDLPLDLVGKDYFPEIIWTATGLGHPDYRRRPREKKKKKNNNSSNEPPPPPRGETWSGVLAERRAQLWHWFLSEYLVKGIAGDSGIADRKRAGLGLKAVAARMYLDHRVAFSAAADDDNTELSLLCKGQGAGVNLFGWLTGSWGVAKAAQRIEAILCAAGVPTQTVDLPFLAPDHQFEDSTLCPSSPRLAPYAIDLFVANADVAPTVAFHLPPDRAPRGGNSSSPSSSSSRYSIGYWAWELAKFPDKWIPNLGLYDEIWVPSAFVRSALLSNPRFPRYARGPVLVVPPVSPPPPRLLGNAADNNDDDQESLSIRGGRGGARLDLAPTDFVFLTVFDYQSSFERKNAIGAVQAFARAFPPPDDDSNASFGGGAPLLPRSRPRLVVKCRLGTARKRTMYALHQQLLDRAASVGRVDVVDAVLPATELAALVGRADCLVALHRGEGFGLDVWDALVSATPVVVTNFSGFVDVVASAVAAVCSARGPLARGARRPPLAVPCRRTHWLVPFEMIRVERTWGPYAAGELWASPDTSAAATAMRDVVDHRIAYADFARALADVLDTDHGVARVAGVVRARLGAIHSAQVASSGREESGRTPDCTAFSDKPTRANCFAACAPESSPAAIIRTLPPPQKLYPRAHQPPTGPNSSSAASRLGAASPTVPEHYRRRGHHLPPHPPLAAAAAATNRGRAFTSPQEMPSLIGFALLAGMLLAGFSPAAFRRRCEPSRRRDLER